MNVIYLLFLANSIYMFILTVWNALFLLAVSKKPSLTTGPKISVCIPARNEEKRLGACLESLCDQSYENYEIIVYDDKSSDRTYELAAAFSEKYTFVTVIKGKELPDGWNGKPHAMQRMSEHASGDILLFTDADTVHGRDSLSFVATNFNHHGTDMLSAYPQHISGSFGARLIQSNIYILSSLFLPLAFIPKTKSPLFSHAIGQYVAFKIESYKAAGGYEAVKDCISEDVFMSRHMKASGYKNIFLDAKKYVICWMYGTFKEAVIGIAKNAFEFFDMKIYPMIILTLYVFFFFHTPFVFLSLSIAEGSIPFILSASLLLSLGTWMTLLYDRRMRWYLPFLFPVLISCILFTTWVSMIKETSGKGYEWKGRILH